MTRLPSSNEDTFGTALPSYTNCTFESLLAPIQRCAAYAFRKLPAARREELTADVVATAYVAFRRLITRGMKSVVYPTVLAKYAIRQVFNGRRVGSRQNICDVLAPRSHLWKRFTVESLDRHIASGQWCDRLLWDRHATPAELVAWKLDFSAWLLRLTPIKRRVALRLAIGDTPSEAANHVRTSRARVSQIRRELQAAWNAFQAEPAAA